MADKSTTAGTNTPPSQRAIDPEHNDVHENDEAFELAYFTNSYPKESRKVNSLVKVIKVVAGIAIAFELLNCLSIALSAYTYSELVTQLDPTIQLGGLGLTASSLLKVLSCVQQICYADDRVSRTPENRLGNK